MRACQIAAMTEKIRRSAGDTVTVLAELQIAHEDLMRRLETDMKKSKPGTKTRLDFLRALGKERRDHCELLQSLGYFPKSLGLSTVEKYEFIATVGMGTNTDPKAIKVVDARLIDQKQLKE